jgi:hypothetical protein
MKGGRKGGKKGGKEEEREGHLACSPTFVSGLEIWKSCQGVMETACFQVTFFADLRSALSCDLLLI